MVRWKVCLLLAMLLLLPMIDGKGDDEDDDDSGRNDENEDEEDEEEDDDDDDASDKLISSRRRATPADPRATRTTKRVPLECYVCGYKSEIPLRSCLDPTKYRVRSVTCHNVDDKCFTTVTSRDKSYVEVIRGCRTGCVGSMGTSCCERNRCNNQAFAMPIMPVARETNPSAAAKPVPPNVVFFVTVLLVLQTVVKVSFV